MPTMNDIQADEPGDLAEASALPEQVLPEQAPVESLGEHFRRTRIAQGLSLETLSAQLKITPRKITAIEEGRFAELPQGPYLRGIIRNYAKALQLDPIAAVTAFERATGSVSIAPDFSLRPSLGTPFSQRPTHSNDSGLGRFMLTATIALMVVAALIAWSGTKSFKTAAAMISSFAMNGKSARVQRVALTRAASPDGAPTLGSATLPDEGTSQNTGVQSAIVSQTLATPPSTPSTDGTPPPTAHPLGQSPVASADQAGGVAESMAATARAGSAALVLRIQDNSWVEITQADGKVLLSQQVPSGSQKSIEGSPPFEVIIGNAPGTELEYRGATVDLTPYTHDRVARLTLK